MYTFHKEACAEIMIQNFFEALKHISFITSSVLQTSLRKIRIPLRAYNWLMQPSIKTGIDS